MGRRADGIYAQEMEFTCGWIIFELGVRQVHMNCLFHTVQPHQQHPDPDFGLA